MFELDFKCMYCDVLDEDDNIFLTDTKIREKLYNEYLYEYNTLNDYYKIDTNTKKYTYNLKNNIRLEELKSLIKNLIKTQRQMFNNMQVRHHSR